MVIIKRIDIVVWMLVGSFIGAVITLLVGCTPVSHLTDEEYEWLMNTPDSVFGDVFYAGQPSRLIYVDTVDRDRNLPMPKKVKPMYWEPKHDACISGHVVLQIRRVTHNGIEYRCKKCGAKVWELTGVYQPELYTY
jgi:hypothetical protein